jgi:hypothetical protein
MKTKTEKALDLARRLHNSSQNTGREPDTKGALKLAKKIHEKRLQKP